MSESVFSTLSIDRSVSRWEEKLYTLSPVEQLEGVWFKREDNFAPLGYGGINGSKLRQLIWLVHAYAKSAPLFPGLLTAASVKSPQLSMGTAVARHFGLPALLVVGATNAKSAIKHENVAIAAWLGAQFVFTPVAYNPSLQKAVKDLASTLAVRDYFQLEYGITVTNSTERIEAFHKVGSEQVRNIPDDIDTLYLPAGSCNSTTSILYGIARFRPKLKRVVLFGIGPTRLDWIEARLKAIEVVSGLQVRHLFRREYRHHPDLAKAHNEGMPKSAPYQLLHFDLHTTKFASYQDEMPFRFAGIDFHPTYEGKVMRYLKLHPGEFKSFWTSGRALFWIVGSRPTRAAMLPALAGDIGSEVPKAVPVWGHA